MSIKVVFLFSYFSEHPCCWTACSNKRNLLWKGFTYFLQQCSKCELNMLLHQSFVQIYEILSQDFRGFSHRRLIWQTRLAKLSLERYELKLNNSFTCEFLLASVTATLPERRKKEAPINYFLWCVLFQVWKGKWNDLNIVGKKLAIKIVNKRISRDFSEEYSKLR